MSGALPPAERLKDAAPKLYSALLRLYDLHMHPTIGDDDPEWSEALQEAHAALAKAEGRS